MDKIREQRSQRFAQLIGLELKSIFVKKEITQTSVADRLGHSRGGFSKWLNAKPSIPVEVLINVCELLSVDPRSIFNNAYNQLIEELGQNPEFPAVDDAHLSAEEKIQLTLEKLKRGDMSIAALHDPNKKAEMNGEGLD